MPKKNATDTWQKIANEFWQDLQSLIRIQPLQNADTALLAPTQIFFLRENLKSRLISARIALLARDETSFKLDIKASRQWLDNFFDKRDPAVRAAITQLQKLDAQTIQINLPEMNSLEVVRDLKLVKERSNAPTKSKP